MYQMRHLIKKISIVSILILSLSITSALSHPLDEKKNISFLSMWEKVDSLENKGLYRMALTEVTAIFNLAIVHKNHEQVIKAVLHELKFNAYLEEDDYVIGISRLESLIPTTPSPSRELLHSLLAEVYWGYYSGNSYKFQNRTSAVEVDLNDIRTWDLKRIAIKIRYHTIHAVLNEKILQAYTLDNYSNIISDWIEESDIRPTLFDFLGHRSLDFFKTTTFSLQGPAETFVMDKQDYFENNATFLKLNVATTDSLNTTFLALRVMHALTDFNQRNNKLKPLFYLELERLEFAYSKSTLPNKVELYVKGMNRLAETYKAHDYSSEAWYALAQLKFQQGYAANAIEPAKQWLIKEAFDICERTISLYPEAFGSQQCKTLQSNILQKDINVTVEESIIPEQANKFQITYKNCNSTQVKIVKLDYDKAQKLYRDGDKLHNELKRDKGVYSKDITLKSPMDYREHSAEFLIPALEAGYYFLVVSSDGSFDPDKGGYSYVPFWVTTLTVESRSNAGYKEVRVTNRASGEPILGALVDVSYNKYNYDKREYEMIYLDPYYTNSQGKIKIPETNDGNYHNLRLKVHHKDEKYTLDKNVHISNSQEKVDQSITTHIYTDRTLYRPGQTIFFKGIMVQNNGKERKLLKNYQTTIYFYDNNNQVVETKVLTTNQFGSFEGSFEAPFGVLTGQMQIKNVHGSKSIRVEEYKRPKFNVKMKPVEGEIMVGDSISAIGIAEAYAGNKIDGAAVTYRVQRSVQYNWGYWWRWYNPEAPKEIANGTLETDENGEFEIRFKALADKTTDPKTLPVFTYKITVDVTDINGETHSTTTTVRAGYQSLELGQNIPNQLNSSSDFHLKLSSRNLNGQPINSQGTILIEQLKTPDRVLHSRLWNAPDQQTWTKEEYAKLFPNAVYDSENEYFNWPVKQKVFEQKFNTAKTDSISLGNYADWEPGIYHYTASAKDKNGIEVKDEIYFTVYNPVSKVSPTNDLLWLNTLQTNAEPGDVITILLATMESDLIVNYETEANGKLIESKSIQLTKEQVKIDFQITEAYRGNFTIHFTTVKNSRSFNQSITIIVPYTNKQLDLRFSTFRNKLLPGEAEEWVMTIKNKLGEKEQAELLATLYDASLDALYTPNSFYFDIYKTYCGRLAWTSPMDMSSTFASNMNYQWNSYISSPYRTFPHLNYFGWSPYYYGAYYAYGWGDGEMYMEDVVEESSSPIESRLQTFSFDSAISPAPTGGLENKRNTSDESPAKKEDNYKDKAIAETGENSGEKSAEMGEVSARSNFNETAFFYPQLTADKNGDVQIKFTIPESLTKWRFLGLAHTQDLKYGTLSAEVVTQKDLMVVPNVPRFLRERDKITLSTKISNISDEALAGQAQLILYDPFTEKEISSDFNLTEATQPFSAEQGKSIEISWSIEVPDTYSAVKYKIVAIAGSFSDGEENVLPILSNRMMVTESLPLPIRGNETKTFNFEKLAKSGQSATLKHHSYTLEFTSNPAWYAIQAMPYMMEYPHECAEQTFTRYYSNAIASHIMNSNPKIKTIIDSWGEESPEAFLSNLQKNQELKAVILEETPWVLDAKSEEDSKRNLAVLLDMGRMSRELDKALSKTIQSQTVNGGWPWFPGMPENRYITQHIVTGMGHLDHLGIKSIREDEKVQRMIYKAVNYLDREIVKDFAYVKKWDKDYLINQHLGYSQIQYLYARSYFPEINLDKDTKEAIAYYKGQAETYWLEFNIYAEGMIALAAHRFEMKELATDIVKSLKDRSIQNEEMGMYWKDYVVGYYWYEAPIETQALMIEVFDEVTDDQAAVDELKIWLLKQKQTTNWKTTKQTTEAVYALLLKGTDLLSSDEMVAITLGGKSIDYIKETVAGNPYQVKAQAGTGYFKTVWAAEQVQPEMAAITVSKKSKGVAWGAVYWQYFDELDKITFAETNLKLNKEIYHVEVTNEGEELRKITPVSPLEVGQKVRVRIELRTDRDLEFVHMKDMRAAGFEPIDVLSRYRYQDGLGYYQSTKDAATHFFFDYIRKGTYVFEYDLRVQHEGEFSNGIATIQCMYAPEFTSHSNGMRVIVK